MKLYENFSIKRFDKYLADKRNWDFFITCTSFEDRSISVSKQLKSYSSKIENTIIVNYPEHDNKNKKKNNTKKIIKNLNEVSRNLIIYDTKSVLEPSLGIKDFKEYIKKRSIEFKEKKILLDISVFTKPYFFLLLKILKEDYNVNVVDIVYTEVLNYNTNDQRKDLFSIGINRIEPIPGFNGSYQNAEEALITFIGFEGNRSLQIYQQISPKIIVVVNGMPSFQPSWHIMSMKRNIEFLKESKGYKNLFYTPTYDPFETIRVLKKIIDLIIIENPKLNITIAPLSTKPISLGIALYSLYHKNIKVIYPYPIKYNTDSSKGENKSWIYRINFNTLQEIY